MHDLPRYLRFARALALVGGLTATGCGDEPDRADGSVSDTAVETAGETTADVSESDTFVAEIDAPEGEVDECTTCDCAAPADPCEQVCCIFVGPLPPPDLPA